MATTVLIIEDEEKIARFIELELRHEGYGVAVAADGQQGLAAFEAGGVDLVLLDIMLPGISGMEVLRRIRKASPVPVILLTARDGVPDKVAGLDSGANDYMTKPFAIEELLARIRSCLRRSAPAGDATLELGGLKLDPDRRQVSYEGCPVELTRREFDLLRVLLENRGIVLSRDSLLERAWGFDYPGETNVVDVYVRYLRAKLDDAFGVRLIHTVRGVGYVMKDA